MLTRRIPMGFRSCLPLYPHLGWKAASRRLRRGLGLALAAALMFGCIEGAQYQGGGDLDATAAPDDGLALPDDGAGAPDDGLVLPDDGAAAPDDGVSLPDDGTNAPDDGTSEADDGATAPDDGVNEADDGAAAPDDGTSEADDGGSGAPDTDADGETAAPPDRDGDGDPDATDCAPDDPRNGHGLVEVCDGQDNNCDDVVDPGCRMTLRAGLVGGGAAYPWAAQSGALRLGGAVIGQTLAGPALRAGATVRLAPGLLPVLGQPAP